MQDPISSTKSRLTVLDAVKEPQEINRLEPSGERADLVKSAFQSVGLPSTDDFILRHCESLSGGQRQRVADRIAVMGEGRIVETGNAHEVMLYPKEAQTKRLVGSRINLFSYSGSFLNPGTRMRLWPPQLPSSSTPTTLCGPASTRRRRVSWR